MEAPIQQNNYVAKIFDVLDNAVKEGQDDPEGALDGKGYKVDYSQCIRPTYSLLYLALDITPVLFSAFLEAFRQKRNTSTSAMQDTSRMAEFGFFVYMLKIIHHSQDLYLETLSRLLKAFFQWNVYHTRNDDITKSQREILNQIADEIVSYLNNDTKRKYDMMMGNNGNFNLFFFLSFFLSLDIYQIEYSHGLVLDVADVLLQIDFSLIETRMHNFWPILLNVSC
jgi:hypothetical protein